MTEHDKGLGRAKKLCLALSNVFLQRLYGVVVFIIFIVFMVLIQWTHALTAHAVQILVATLNELEEELLWSAPAVVVGPVNSATENDRIR